MAGTFHSHTGANSASFLRCRKLAMEKEIWWLKPHLHFCLASFPRQVFSWTVFLSSGMCMVKYGTFYHMVKYGTFLLDKSPCPKRDTPVFEQGHVSGKHLWGTKFAIVNDLTRTLVKEIVKDLGEFYAGREKCTCQWKLVSVNVA